jgi:beta-glucanase (GH16 family)
MTSRLTRALPLSLVALALCAPLASVFGSYHAGERLVFADEFETLDNEVWEHELTLGGGGNWEFQYYTNNRTNSFVKDGVLHLKPTLTSDLTGDESLMNGHEINLWGSTPADQCTGNAFYGCQRSAGGGGNVLNPIQSARLRTAQSFSFRYGRVEIRAKLPKGDWIWPAIWMMPRYNAYGGWPASGEIDIMESRGNSPGYAAGGYDSFGSTLHWGPDFSRNPYKMTHADVKVGDLHSAWHTYGLKWDETGLYTYIDDDSNRVLQVPFDQEFWTKGGWSGSDLTNPWAGRSNAAPFDQKFYLIMNVAVGGTADYFPEGVGGKPWNNKDGHAVNSFWNARNQWLPTWHGDDVAMQVDWVHVYA